ncbi:DUF1775 domain-containing protein [Rhodococcus rhodnii]|uniref:YncI copper-binding domain-containing protein n=2 Tax=Rhodococcus rhodnii TaxID=38312 RepID=R7WK12_9NOCA|nr:YcnI family protein [Rhodococcus rhodnii]EOM74309.1 hypothetical protein Rrhod_4453 [Rhodococcus rhodnii LMG 5362]TXG89556.1 DUF1775 domain-containing protein [Rhodococcus rhodnii]
MNVITRGAVALGAATGLLVAGAGVASAHVSVVAPGAEQGGYGVLTFRVPTESDTASTTSVRVELPNLTSARTEPVPGWTAVVDRDPASQEATAVTWTADPGTGIAPGEFGQFMLSAGPLPESEDVSFPTEQGYSDGEVVAWDQPVGDDGSEPEYPAPMLTLAAGSGGHGHSHGGDTPAQHDGEAAATADASDDTARWLGGAGLVLGALGAAFGLVALVRSRRS